MLEMRPSSQLRFLEIDDLPHEVLCEARAYVRPPARMVLDLSRGGQTHNISIPAEIFESRKAVLSLDGGIALGSVLARSGDGFIIPTSSLPMQRDALLASLRGSGVDFGSGLRFEGVIPFLVDQPHEDIPGDLVSVTPDEWDNFGMWLLQTLPALVLAERRGFEGSVLCRVERPWQREFVEAFAPRLSKRLVRHQAGVAYRADRLTVMAQDRRNFVLTDFDREIFDELAVSVGQPAVIHEKIFISRLGHSQRNPGYRALLNEVELIDRLLDHGFAVVEPETLSIKEQIRLFSHANLIVGLGGAGMFGSVFARPGTKIVSIESSSGWISAHANLFASRGLDYGVIFGRQITRDAPPHQRWSLPIDPAIEAILAF